MKCIPDFKPEIPPLKTEIKLAILQRLLDIEYGPGRGSEREDDTWDDE